MALVFIFLYAPIFLLIIFSFNAGSSNTVWKGFSLEWYGKLFQNRLIMQSVYTTLLVSLLATVIATVTVVSAATVSSCPTRACGHCGQHTEAFQEIFPIHYRIPHENARCIDFRIIFTLIMDKNGPLSPINVLYLCLWRLCGR